MAGRINDTSLPHPVRLIGDREHLCGTSCDRPRLHCVRIVDVKTDSDCNREHCDRTPAGDDRTLPRLDSAERSFAEFDRLPDITHREKRVDLRHAALLGSSSTAPPILAQPAPLETGL